MNLPGFVQHFMKCRGLCQWLCSESPALGLCGASCSLLSRLPLSSLLHDCSMASTDTSVIVAATPGSCSVNSELFQIQSWRMEWLRRFGERGFLWGLDLQTFTCVRRLRELKQPSSGTEKEWGRRVNTAVNSGI